MESLTILLEETGYEIAYMQFTAASEEILRFQGSLKEKILRTTRYYAYKATPHLSSLFMGGSVMVIMRPVCRQTNAMTAEAKGRKG
jgi:hypothetical protein